MELVISSLRLDAIAAKGLSMSRKYVAVVNTMTCVDQYAATNAQFYICLYKHAYVTHRKKLKIFDFVVCRKVYF